MTRRTIEELLEFINRFSYERNLSWDISHLYEDDISFEIQWLYDRSTDMNFYFRKITKDEEKVWTNTTYGGLFQLMQDEKVDLSNFELQLLKSIGVQVVCCHYYMERASDLIGADKVEQIVKLIDEIASKETKKQPAPRLKVVPRKKKDDDDK